MTRPAIFADLDLARRLEAAEGHSNSMFVEARARAFPEAPYEWKAFGTTRAMFDGVDSPITQTFGFGLGDRSPALVLDEIENFFASHGSPVRHEVSPLATAEALFELVDRGYAPVEFSSVLFLPLQGMRASTHTNSPFEVRPIRPDEGEVWADTTVKGWSDYPELESFLRELAPVSTQREHSISLLAFENGEPVAAGAMSLYGGVILLGGACTIPEARRRGAQSALLEYRLRHASENGCDVAMMGAEPGSASQRNAERQGFRIAYTRIKWQKREMARP